MRKGFKSILSFALCVIFIYTAFTTVAFAADLGELADEFNSAVSAFADTTILETQLEAISSAESKLNAYTGAGGSVNDPAISESYEALVELKAEVEAVVAACDSFAYYVSEAVYYHSEDMYPETRANLDLAAEYISLIRMSDPYVSGAYADYIRITGELNQPEKLCASFVSYAKQAAEATTYAEVERYLGYAKSAEGSIELEGFIGEEEAYANIAKAEAFIKERKKEALVFISAVSLIKHDDLESFRSAISALDGVDVTTEGVESAMDKLESYIDAYNAKVKEANAMLKGACETADCMM